MTFYTEQSQYLYEDEPAVLSDSDTRAGLSPFCQDSLRRISSVYVAWLIIAAFFAAALKYMPGANLDYQVGLAVCFYFTVAMVHVVRRLKEGGTANVLAPDILFVFVYTLFHQGYLVLYLMGVVPFIEFVFYSISSVPVSLAIITLGLVGFLLGYELFGCSKPPEMVRQVRRIPTDGWGAVGIAIMVLGILMHVGTLGALGLTIFKTYGYTAVRRLNEFVGGPWPMIWGRSDQVFTLGMTIYVIYSGLRYQKLFYSKAAIGLTIFLVSMLVLEGSRGPLFLILTPPIIVRHYLVKPIKMRTLLLMLATVLFLFTVMKIVRGWALSPGQMMSELQFARSSGEMHWSDIFVEMGSSYRIANMTASLVPETEGFWRGLSWLDAVVHVVPFLEGFMVRHGVLTYAPSQWITLRIVGPDAAGLGFSLPTEGYLNFGLLGTLIEMMFFGLLIRRVTIWFSRRPSAFTALVMVGILGPTIKVVRDHVSLVTPMFALVLLLSVLLDSCLGSEAEETQEENENPEDYELIVES